MAKWMRTKFGSWTIRIEIDDIVEITKKLSIDLTKEVSDKENIETFNKIMTFTIFKSNGQTQTATISYGDYIKHAIHQYYYFQINPKALKITNNK